MVLSLRSGMPFGILNDLEDLAALMEIRAADAPPKDTWKKIDTFLQGRAKKALADIKRTLGVKVGRPRDEEKRTTWFFGSELRRQGQTWAQITRHLDPHGYAEDRQGATDRMRLGIQAVSK
jgi:hypothetical protein